MLKVFVTLSPAPKLTSCVLLMKSTPAVQLVPPTAVPFVNVSGVLTAPSVPPVRETVIDACRVCSFELNVADVNCNDPGAKIVPNSAIWLKELRLFAVAVLAFIFDGRCFDEVCELVVMADARTTSTTVRYGKYPSFDIKRECSSKIKLLIGCFPCGEKALPARPYGKSIFEPVSKSRLFALYIPTGYGCGPGI